MVENQVALKKQKCAISVRKKIVPLTREEIILKVKPPPNVEFLPKQLLNSSGQIMEYVNQEHVTAKNVKSHLVETNSNAVKNDPSNSCLEQTFTSKCCVRTKQSGDASCNVSSKTFRFVSPPKRLFKLTTEAIEEFNMIKNNDKVLVCLSGGKVIVSFAC